MYVEAVTKSGGPLDNGIGFIDGTKIQIAPPSGNAQKRSVYSGHKRMHCLSFQTVTTPDGLIFHMFGPIEGGQPDAYLYRATRLEDVSQDALKVGNV